MTLSNHSDTVARFWRKYRFSLAESGVKPAALHWYAHHAAAYVKAADGQRLATHSAAIVESWLGELGRVDGMPAWRFTRKRPVPTVLRSPQSDALISSVTSPSRSARPMAASSRVSSS